MSLVKHSSRVGLQQGGRETLGAQLILDGLPISENVFGKKSISKPLRDSIYSKLAPQILTAIQTFRETHDLKSLTSVQVTMHDSDKASVATSEILDDSNSHWKSVEPQASFDRLVLPPNTLQLLDDAATAITDAVRVFDEWGFRANYHGTRPACVINFFGPPGTGKTASAHALAKKLGVPILVAQYSQIESKYVGDSSKNLDSLFLSAEQDSALLLFDEADILLSKRVASQSSSDHAVNALRTSMLLWLERFSGICVLATNNRESYDQAFDRRILFDIPFSLPNAQEIERIVATHLPAKAPIHGAASPGAISLLLEGFSGADIRDTVLKAALAGSREGSKELTLMHFQNAATVIRATRRSKQASDWIKNRVDTLPAGSLKEK